MRTRPAYTIEYIERLPTHLVEEVDGSIPEAYVDFSDLSIEEGHFYAEDLNRSHDQLVDHFTEVHEFDSTQVRVQARKLERAPIVSRALLIDDYDGKLDHISPKEAIGKLLRAAAAAGIIIDYVAREGACAEYPLKGKVVSLAAAALGAIVSMPPPGTNGGRPPTPISGWLTNGTSLHEDGPPTPALTPSRVWDPPREVTSLRDSIVKDIQLFEDNEGHRRWTCSYLAHVWALQRLGALEYNDAPVAVPTVMEGGIEGLGEFDASWNDVPPLMQFTQDAPPLWAYRTHSILPVRYMETEAAVRSIISQSMGTPRANKQARRLARAEGIELSAQLIERMTYSFVENLPSLPARPKPRR